MIRVTVCTWGPARCGTNDATMSPSVFGVRLSRTTPRTSSLSDSRPPPTNPVPFIFTVNAAAGSVRPRPSRLPKRSRAWMSKDESTPAVARKFSSNGDCGPLAGPAATTSPALNSVCTKSVALAVPGLTGETLSVKV